MKCDECGYETVVGDWYRVDVANGAIYCPRCGHYQKVK